MRRHFVVDVDALDRELVDALGLLDALQVALAPRVDRDAVGESRPEERARGLREQHVPALRRRADASGADDVEADVALLREVRLARVQADPNADGAVVRPLVRGVRALHVGSCSDRLASPRKREEERVPLGVDLDALGAERVTDQPPVLGEHLGVALPERPQERRRVLDVGEHEGHRPARKRRHPGIVGTSVRKTSRRS